MSYLHETKRRVSSGEETSPRLIPHSDRPTHSQSHTQQTERSNSSDSPCTDRLNTNMDYIETKHTGLTTWPQTGLKLTTTL